MTHGILAPYFGAGAHPSGGEAVFDRISGYFRPPSVGDIDLEIERPYRFNLNGFRSPEFDAHVGPHIFACGCSYTFGMGVDDENTWPVAFAAAVSEELGASGRLAQIQNFSQIGASNNYITRTLITQCNRARPTLAVAAFTHANRTEYLDGASARNIGYWNISDPVSEELRATSPGKCFFNQYSDAQGWHNLLTNMVLFQSAMQCRQIPYLMIWVDVERFEGCGETIPPALKAYFSVLDQSRISKLSIKQPHIRVDISDGHPGPVSHERFSAALANEFEGRLLAVGNPKSSKLVCQERPIQIRLKSTSAGELARSIVNVAGNAGGVEATARLSRGLIVQNFVDEKPNNIDVELRAFRRSSEVLRRAYLKYTTPETMMFEFWLNVVMSQELLKAHGATIIVEAPLYWMAKNENCNPALGQLLSLLDHATFSPLPRRSARYHSDILRNRLAEAKYRTRQDLTASWFIRRSKNESQIRQDDPNIYPLW
jgi:hypothetical protein